MTIRKKITRIKTLPLLPLRGLVVFPGALIHFDVGRTKSLSALHHAMETDQILILALQKDPTIDNPSIEDVFSVGVVSRIVQIMKLPDDNFRVTAEGLYRASISSLEQIDPHYEAYTVEYLDRNVSDEIKKAAFERELREKYKMYSSKSPVMTSDMDNRIAKADSLGELCDLMANYLPIPLKEKQRLIETAMVSRRAEKVLFLLDQEQQILEMDLEIQSKVQKKIDDNQKDYYLREQIKVISEELGEEDNPQEEAEEFRNQLLKLSLPKDVFEKLSKECNKLAKMPIGSHQATVVRNYLEICLSLPWNISSEERKNLKKSRKILDEAHFGLKDVKEQIMEILAVRQLSNKAKGHILCLVGPPGVGKTSVAKSIAEAMNRKYVRVALGGVKDESDIRGHRRTYIGSMTGRIMDAIQRAGTNNPLMLLDEVDKLGNDYRGDPSSALLEVLDTEQNFSFVDHFLDVPFDLSQVMFITTANVEENIPEPLRDRMDIIRIPGYTEQEKIQIAKRFLVPKQIDINGLTKTEFSLSDGIIKALVEGYTKEAGVRNLERLIAKLCRKQALKKLEEKTIERISIKNLENLLGPKKYKNIKPNTKNVGVVNGLAWTSVGGELLPIEVCVMDGTGKIELTGSLGDVMKESAKLAISYARVCAKKWNIDVDFYKSKDIHIHAPEGAIPKEGPSAGVTMITALFSVLTERKVRKDIAMTGEISLTGQILPIGGLKEKIMAAYMNGMKKIFIPKENESDLEEVSDEIRNSLEIVLVSSVDELLDKVFMDVK